MNLERQRVEFGKMNKLYWFLFFLWQDDTLKQQMNSFLLSTASQHEIGSLDSKVHCLICKRKNTLVTQTLKTFSYSTCKSIKVKNISLWSFFQDFKISPNFLAVKMLDTVPFVILRSRSNMNNSVSSRSFFKIKIKM